MNVVSTVDVAAIAPMAGAETAGTSVGVSDGSGVTAARLAEGIGVEGKGAITSVAAAATGTAL